MTESPFYKPFGGLLLIAYTKIAVDILSARKAVSFKKFSDLLLICSRDVFSVKYRYISAFYETGNGVLLIHQQHDFNSGIVRSDVYTVRLFRIITQCIAVEIPFFKSVLTAYTGFKLKRLNRTVAPQYDITSFNYQRINFFYQCGNLFLVKFSFKFFNQLFKIHSESSCRFLYPNTVKRG